MDIFQNEDMLRRLGVSDEKLQKLTNPMERIKQTVSNFAVLEPEEGKTIEGMVDIIEDVMGANIAYRDTNGKNRTFDEARALLKNPERLWTLDILTQSLVDRFRKYAEWGFINDKASPRDLEVALGDVILRLMHRSSVQEPRSLIVDVERELVLGYYDAGDELKRLQQIPGCAGGGNTMDSVTPREVKLEDNKKILCCTCPFCNEEVEAVIAGGRITCPKKGCGKSVKWKD